MKPYLITALFAAILILPMERPVYCGSLLMNYAQTVDLIKTTMEASPSAYRKESYGAIKFDDCRLDYSVAGTYPVGDLYNIKFTGIDFSSLDPAGAKTGNDYTPFIIVSFAHYFTASDGHQELQQRNLVVNLDSEEKAAVLLKAFLHFGEICRGGGRG